MLSWLTGNKAADAVVELVLHELQRRYPPAMSRGEGRRLSQQAVTNILEAVLQKGVSSAAELKLGWFGKARVANEVRWKLKDLGYGEKFIEVFVEALVVYLTRRSKD